MKDKLLKLRSGNLSLVVVTVVVILLFFSQNSNFLSYESIRSIMNSMSFTGILTIGMAMLLIGGEVDLSVGSIACFSGLVMALMINAGMPWGLAVFITLLFGIACGLINSFFINKLGFTSFIATLGLMSVYQGFVELITHNKNVMIPSQGVWVIGSTTVAGVIPLPFFIFIVLVVIYSLVMRSTGFGRNIYMCGGNRRAARLCGISPKKISTLLYANSGLLAAVAGGSGAVDAITAAVLGGVSFLGGSGNIIGCFMGILLINVFDAGMTAIGFPSYWQIVVRGGLLVLALCLDFLTTRSRNNALKRS